MDDISEHKDKTRFKINLKSHYILWVKIWMTNEFSM